MSNKTVKPHNSSLWNLEANLLALLSYLVASALMIIPGVCYFAWAVPLVVFLLETKSKYVKFHAMQSFVIHAISALVAVVLNVIVRGLVIAAFTRPYSLMGSLGIVSVLSLLSSAVSIVILVFSILAMIKSYQYTEYKIPLIAPITSWINNLISGKKTTGESNVGGADANVQQATPEQAATEERPAAETDVKVDASQQENVSAEAELKESAETGAEATANANSEKGSE
jgi:uncharacterized membrane protein